MQPFSNKLGVAKNADPLVHLHLHLASSARRDLRVAAATLGMTMSDLVSHWAVATAKASGLTVAPGVSGREVNRDI